MSITESNITELIPEASRYMIRKARNLRSRIHFWAFPDPYTYNTLKKADLEAALAFYTNDELIELNEELMMKIILSSQLQKQPCIFPAKL